MKKLVFISTALLGSSLILGVLAATADLTASSESSESAATSPRSDSLPEDLLARDQEMLALEGSGGTNAPVATVPTTDAAQAGGGEAKNIVDYKAVLEPVGEGGKEVLNPKLLPEPVGELSEALLPASASIIPGAEFLPPTEILEEPNPANVAGPIVSPSSL